MSVKIVARNMQWYLVALGISIFVVLLFTGNVSAADQVPVVPPVTLQTSLASIISQVQSGVEAGVGFLKQEIPDVIRQLLLWKAVSAMIWAIFALLLALATIPVQIWAFKYHKNHHKSYDFPGHIFLSAFSVLVAGMAVARFIVNGLEALQIYLAPKVWLVEYAVELVKK